MKTEFKNKPIVILLIMITILNALSALLFLFMNRIVNVDLYNYGLVYNSEWSTPYQLYSQLTLSLLLASVALAMFSIGLVHRYRARQSSGSRAIIYSSYAFLILATILSLLFLTRSNDIVNTTLYSYGLRHSNEWALYYQMELQLYFGLTTCSVVAALISTTLFFYKTQPLGKIRFTKLISPTVIITGLAALVFSIIFASQIPAFMGLGLLFWGIIIRYITTEEYVRQPILDATALTPLKIINENIRDLKYSGKAVYLPPQYLTEIESNKACITKNENTKLPTPEEAQLENRSLIQDPDWLLLTPPGNELTRLFEKTLKTDFTKTNLPFLEQNLPKLLIEDLEIAETLQIQTANNVIKIVLENTIYAGIFKETQAPNSLGCPIASAIACALAKAMGKPVVMRSERLFENEKTIALEYEILEPLMERQEQ
jgi:hypothetical protein